MDSAVLAIRQAIARQPDYALAHERLGEALYRQKKYDEAVVALRRAIELEPTLSEPHASLGYVLFAQDRIDASADAWRKAVELNGQRTDYQIQLGFALEWLGKDAEAADAFRRAAESLRPDWIQSADVKHWSQPGLANADRAVAVLHLGIVLEKQAKHQEAADALVQAVQSKPENSEHPLPPLGRCFRIRTGGKRRPTPFARRAILPCRPMCIIP